MKNSIFLSVFFLSISGLADPQLDLCMGISQNDKVRVQKALAEGASLEGNCGERSVLDEAKSVGNPDVIGWLLELGQESKEHAIGSDWVFLQGDIPKIEIDLPNYLTHQGDYKDGWVYSGKEILPLPALPASGFLASGDELRSRDGALKSLLEIQSIKKAFLASKPIDWPLPFKEHGALELKHSYKNLGLLKEKIDILTGLTFELKELESRYRKFRVIQDENIEDLSPSGFKSKDEAPDFFQKSLKNLTERLLKDTKDMNRFFEYGLLHLRGKSELKTIIKSMGVKNELRPYIWQMLLGYRTAGPYGFKNLENRREEYHRLFQERFPRGMLDHAGLGRSEKNDLGTVLVDLPRTNGYFRAMFLQASLKKVLFLFAVEHGYIQGENEIAKQLLLSFAKAYFNATPKNERVSTLDLSETDLLNLEADAFWSMSNLMAPVFRMALEHGKKEKSFYGEVFKDLSGDLIERILPDLNTHIVNELLIDVDLFASIWSFPWSIYFFQRELSPATLEVLWDAYMLDGEAQGFALLHPYVCIAILEKLKPRLLKEKAMSEMMDFLAENPLAQLTDYDIQAIIIRAQQLREKFKIKQPVGM